MKKKEIGLKKILEIKREGFAISKGKIKLERYFQKKSLERLETFIIQEKGIYLFLYSFIY